MKRVGFLTLEAWLIRRIRSSRLTRQRALWYLSRLGQAEWSWSSEGPANVSQGRTGQDRAGWGQNGERTGYFLGLSPSDILVDHTRVSACPICPINKCDKCTYVWHKFSLWNFVFKFVMNSSILIFAAMHAVNVTSPAQLPLVSGCWSSGEWELPPWSHLQITSLLVVTQSLHLFVWECGRDRMLDWLKFQYL